MVKVFLHSSLNDEEIKLKPIVRGTIQSFNDLPALNPWLDEVSSDCCEDIKVRTHDYDDPYIFGEAVITHDAAGLISRAVIRFNTDIAWKSSTNGYCYSIPVYPNVACTQDARKVSNHEMGHAQGLAHEFSPTVAVMRQGFLDFYKIQADDKSGIVAIYGAYP